MVTRSITGCIPTQSVGTIIKQRRLRRPPRASAEKTPANAGFRLILFQTALTRQQTELALGHGRPSDVSGSVASAAIFAVTMGAKLRRKRNLVLDFAAVALAAYTGPHGFGFFQFGLVSEFKTWSRHCPLMNK